MRSEITTSEAADIIGCTDDTVRKLCRNVLLSARMVGNSCWISLKDAKAYRDRPKRRGAKRSFKPVPPRNFIG